MTGHKTSQAHRETASANRKAPSDRMTAHARISEPDAPALRPTDEMLDVIGFLDGLGDELEGAGEQMAPGPCFRMILHLIRAHLEGRTVTPTAMIGASGASYGTANRRLSELVEAGLIERRPRTRTGRSHSLHPSPKLLDRWSRLTARLRRLAETNLRLAPPDSADDYYYGGSYMAAQTIPPMQVLPEPLMLPGGLRMLVHGDPTFMVMENARPAVRTGARRLGSAPGLSIDRLREEALRNAERAASRYDLVAVDLPWIGEFAESGVLMPLENALDVARLDPADFHTAGWQATHWGGRPYAVPAQTTPELLFWRRDRFAEAGSRRRTRPTSCWPQHVHDRAPRAAPTASPGTRRAALRLAIP
jgi:multiple sugar transport system substrate-binding protein